MKNYFKGVQIARHSSIIMKISRNIVEVPKGASEDCKEHSFMRLWSSRSIKTTMLYSIFEKAELRIIDAIPTLIIVVILFQINLPYIMRIRNNIETVNCRKKVSGSQIIYSILIISLLFINIIRLCPSILGITLSIRTNLTLAITMWLAITIRTFTYNPKVFFINLNIPSSRKGISLFLACIEFIRYNIRPLTLAIRLTANLTVGHLIMRLMHIVSEPWLRIIRSFYTCFELVIYSLQTYIFVILLMIYTSSQIFCLQQNNSLHSENENTKGFKILLTDYSVSRKIQTWKFLVLEKEKIQYNQLQRNLKP